MIEFKFCKECKRAYDVGANLDICTDCRIKSNKLMENDSKKE